MAARTSRLTKRTPAGLTLPPTPELDPLRHVLQFYTAERER